MTRLVAFHLQYNKGNYINWFLPESEKQVCMTLIHCLPLPMTIVAKCSPQADDAKHQYLMPLGEFHYHIKLFLTKENKKVCFLLQQETYFLTKTL
jgi:hypothetical protein